MRILITQETDWIERNPLQQHHLAEILTLRGHSVRVIDYEILWKTQGKKTLYSKRHVFNNVVKVYPGAGITVVRPGIVKIWPLDYASILITHRSEIYRQIREFKPDIILGFGILNSYLALKAAKKNNLPFVYHWLDVLHWLIPFKPFQGIGKIVESTVLKQADGVIAVSDKLKEYVVNLGAIPERVRVVKPGITLSSFDPYISGAGIRKQYGIQEKDIVLFFMGWLYHFSGLKEVAIELAKTNNKNVKLIIVGAGDAWNDLRRIQEDNNLQDRMILTGHIPYPQIPAFIAASDICLLPAYPHEKLMQDGLPAKIYEYLAMGKPMISTHLPSVMKEFGEDNGVVYIDQPEDTVAKALDLMSSGKVKDAGLKARKFAENYDWQTIADHFEKCLKEFIGENRIGIKS